MSWPTGTVNTTNLDESTDSPAQARADIKQMADFVNTIIGGRASSGGVASLTTDATPVVPSSQLGNALLKANDLSDLNDAATARTNLGATAVGSSVFTAASAAAARSAISAEQSGVALLKSGGTMTGTLTLTTGDPTGDFSAVHKKYADSSGALTGEIRLYGSSTAPSGWLNCDGSAVSRTTYSALFAVIGTTYGAGDGSTTFNLPDFRSRMPIGQGQGSGLTNRAMGGQYGAETFTLSVSNLAVHNHSASISPVSSGNYGSYANRFVYNLNYANTTSKPVTVNNAGSGSAKAHQGPSLGVNFIIKT